MRFISFLFVLIISQAFASEKTKTILRYDSCANAATYYTPINDSVYAVKALFNGTVIFEGQIYQPDTNGLFNPNYLQNDYPYYKFNGYCQFYALNGQPLEKAYYHLGKKKDRSTYRNGLLQNKETFTRKKHIQEIYKNGQIQSRHTFKGLSVKSIYYGGPRPYRTSNRIYTISPFIKKYASLNANGYISKKDIYYRFSKKIHLSYTYADSGQLLSVSAMDKNGFRTNYQSYNSNGKRDSLILESNTFYALGKNKRIIHYKNVDHPMIYGQRVQEFTFDTAKRSIFYRENEKAYNIKHQGNLIQIQEHILADDAEYDEVEYLHNDSCIYIKCYKNKVLKFARTFYYPEAPITPHEFLKLKPENWINNLLPFDYLGDYNSYCIKYPSAQYVQYKDEKTNFLYIDSSFNSKKLESVCINAYDSFIRYNYPNGTPVLNYHSKAYRIAKDLQQCGTGLKDFNQHWIIPPHYDQVQLFLYDSNSLYICMKGEYTSIYNWKGEMLFSNIKNIGIPYDRNSYWDERIIHIPDSFANEKKLKSNWAIKFNDKEQEVYELKSINKTTIKKFPCAFAVFNIGDNILQFRLTDSMGRQGISDLDKTIIPQIYSYIESLGDSHFIAHHFTDSVSILNPDGKICHSFKQVEIMRLYDSVLMVIDQSKFPRLFNYYKCQYIEAAKDYQIITKYDDWYSIKKGNLHGRVDHQLKTIIPPKYASINNFYGHWICRNKDSFDFYKTNGQLIAKLVCDTLFDNDSRSKQYAYDGDATVFKIGNQFGLINAYGKMILAAEFSDIAIPYLQESNGAYLAFRNDTFYFYKRDEHANLVQFNPFPFSSYIFYNSLCNTDQHNGILNAKGELIIEDLEHFSNNADIYSITPINKNGKFIGSIDRLGQWKFKSNDYQLAEENHRGQFLVLDHARHAGLVSCSGKTIIKPEYQYIVQNYKYNLLWFNCIQIPQIENHPNTYKGIWKIKNISDNKILNDTFLYPQEFENAYLICQNANKRWGILDSNAHARVPFIYQSYTYLMDEQIAFKRNDSILDLYDKDKKKIKSIKLKKIARLNPNTYLGFDQSCTYLIDSNFHVTDSSKLFFCEHPTLHQKIDYFEQLNLVSNIGPLISPLFEKSYGNPKFDLLKDFNFPSAAINFLKTIAAYQEDAVQESAIDHSIIFPTPKYEVYDNYYQGGYNYDNLRLFNNTGIFTVFTDNMIKPVYTPRKFMFVDLDDVSYYLQNFSNQTLSFQLIFPHRSELDELRFENIFFDSILGPLKFDLYDLIEDKKGFSDYVYQSLKKLDNPNIPCFPNSDYLEKFSSMFMIEKETLILMIDAEYQLKLEIKNLLPYFQNFWKIRLKS